LLPINESREKNISTFYINKNYEYFLIQNYIMVTLEEVQYLLISTAPDRKNDCGWRNFLVPINPTIYQYYVLSIGKLPYVYCMTFSTTVWFFGTFSTIVEFLPKTVWHVSGQVMRTLRWRLIPYSVYVKFSINRNQDNAKTCIKKELILNSTLISF